MLSSKKWHFFSSCKSCLTETFYSRSLYITHSHNIWVSSYSSFSNISEIPTKLGISLWMINGITSTICKFTYLHMYIWVSIRLDTIQRHVLYTYTYTSRYKTCVRLWQAILPSNIQSNMNMGIYGLLWWCFQGSDF